MNDCAFLPWKLLARVILDGEFNRDRISERYSLESKSCEWAFVQN